MAPLELSAHMTVRPGWPRGLQETSGGAYPDYSGEGLPHVALRLVPEPGWD
jgi:hypothetical protein